ncbi:MAG TPA: flavin reductase family protein [Firmicutes bacterium]|nr:flavin reductase family protein [Bacillota bacterium]
MKKIDLGATHFLYPQPAVIVGANVDGKPNYLTIAWCGIMQGKPPIIEVALNKSRYTSPGIKENKTFSVNVPSSNLVVETDYVGITSGKKADKSKVFKSFYGETKTAPMIEECPVNMECRLLEILDYKGSHEIFVGEIVKTYVNEDCLSDGVPDVRKIDPIIFSTGDHNYWRLGEHLADAFTVGKEYKSGD